VIAIVVDVDSEAVKLGFKKIEARRPEINRRILGLLGSAVVARADSKYLTGGHPLHRVTGLLAQSVTESPDPGPGYIDVGTNVPYGIVHELGLTVTVPAHRRTRNGKSYQVGTYTANYPKRAFMAPAIADIFQTMKARTIIQQTLKEELKRCL